MSLTRCPEGHLFSSRRYGSICPYCNKVVTLSNDRNYSNEDLESHYNDSTPYMGDLEVMDPVVGWLVCIEGPSKGQDYKIRSEKNFIGRSDGMNIQILGDNYIAKRNHAIIVYEPKKRKTLLLPGDSQGLVYHNDEAIYTPEELQEYDTIEIGKSKFLFVPFCGENFEWQETNETSNNLDKKSRKNEETSDKTKKTEKPEKLENHEKPDQQAIPAV